MTVHRDVVNTVLTTRHAIRCCFIHSYLVFIHSYLVFSLSIFFTSDLIGSGDIAHLRWGKIILFSLFDQSNVHKHAVS